MHALLNETDAGLLSLAQEIYDIPSLAAWRAAELRVLRNCTFAVPLLEIGCGNGRFASLLFNKVDWGIDFNPREIALCEKRPGVYGRLSCMDARRLIFADGVFATVFANCVMEHIPDLGRVLAECRRVLMPGGTLIATVPLIGMNEHLLLKSSWYTRIRSEQLQHLHLLTEDAWKTALDKAGFSSVKTTPYLSARMCELWDRVDGPLSMGRGPIRLSLAYRMGLKLMPAPLRSQLNHQWQRYFMRGSRDNPSETPCAVLIQAAVAA